MAVICPYNNLKCSSCPHNRPDEDWPNRMACYLKQDLSKEEFAKTQEQAWKKILIKQEERKG